MSFVQRLVVDITVDASGDATVYSDQIQYGRISQIRYVKHGTNPFDNTVDFTVTVEATGEAVWSQSNVTASATIAPRQATHDVLGAASLYAAGGEPVEDKIAVARDRIKIVVAQGGNAKQGTLHIILS